MRAYSERAEIVLLIQQLAMITVHMGMYPQHCGIGEAMKRWLLALASICLAFGVGGEALAEAPLRIGVLPNVSARVILTSYQPMRQYFERALERPVEILTSPDFKSFYQRTVFGDYDLAVTAANLGRLAVVDHKMVPIAIFDPPISGLMVMLKARPVRDAMELRGQKLALANPQSLVALSGLGYLKERGLLVNRDFTTVRSANEDSLAQLLTSGEAPLAVMSRGEFSAIRESIRSQLEIQLEFGKVPGFLMLLGAQVPADLESRLRMAVSAFPESPEAQSFFNLSGVRGIRAPTEAELLGLDAFVAETRRFMSAP